MSLSLPLRAGALFLAFLGILCLLGGCTKDSLLTLYNDAIEAAGALPLSSPESLPGQLERREEGYAGSYTAELEDYTGEFLLFGGTSIDKAADAQAQVCYAAACQAGDICLFYQLGSDSPQTLLQGSGAYGGSVPTPPGSCYIGLRLQDFSGTISLCVQ